MHEYLPKVLFPPVAARLAAAISPDVGGDRAVELSRCRDIVVVRLDEMGDVVMNSAFVRELRGNAPTARIRLVVRQPFLPLVAHCPHVDAVHGLEVSVVKRLNGLGALPAVRRFVRDTLGDERPDLAVNPRWDVDFYGATLLQALSGARSRVGYTESSTPVKARINRGYDRLLTLAARSEPGAHAVGRSLRLLETLGGTVEDERLEIWLTAADWAVADRNIAPLREAGGPVVAYALGASRGRRRWPAERFADVASNLRAQHRASAVLVGGPGDREAAAAFIGRFGTDGVLDLCGALALRESGAVIEACDLLVANDSGPLHLAAATGTPVVEISCHPTGAAVDGPNSPVRFGPWHVPHKILRPRARSSLCRSGCVVRHRPHCILGVEVSSAASAATELLAHEPSP